MWTENTSSLSIRISSSSADDLLSFYIMFIYCSSKLGHPYDHFWDTVWISEFLAIEYNDIVGLDVTAHILLLHLRSVNGRPRVPATAVTRDVDYT